MSCESSATVSQAVLDGIIVRPFPLFLSSSLRQGKADPPFPPLQNAHSTRKGKGVAYSLEDFSLDLGGSGFSTLVAAVEHLPNLTDLMVVHAGHITATDFDMLCYTRRREMKTLVVFSGGRSSAPKWLNALVRLFTSTS